jgi:hypothetical protein
MKIKKVLLASLLVGPLMGESVTTSGFYVGVLVGGSHVGVHSFFRKEGEKKADQKKYGELSGFGGSFGGEVGAGFEMSNIFVGINAYGGATVKELTTEASKKTGNVSLSLGDEKTATSYSLAVDQTMKVKAFYGASIQLGGKVSQSCLVYASFGVEGTYLTPSQKVLVVAKETDETKAAEEPGRGFALANGTVTYDTTTEPLKSIAPENIFSLKVAPGDSKAKGTTLVSLAPGLGIKYLLTSGIYVGVQLDVLIGLNKKANDDQLDKDTKVDWALSNGASPAASAGDKTYTIKSAKAQKVNVYYKQPVGCRVGLKLGYKF